MDHKFIHPLETRYRTEIAELFTEEKKLRKQTILFIFVTLIIGMVVFAASYFVTK